MLHFNNHVTRQHLWIAHGPIDRIDGPARHPGSFQALQPLGSGTCHKDVLQQGDKRLNMLETSATTHKTRVIGQFWTLDGHAQGAPKLVSIGVKYNMDILGLKSPNRHRRDMPRPCWHRDFPYHKIVDSAVDKQCDLGVEERHID